MLEPSLRYVSSLNPMDVYENYLFLGIAASGYHHVNYLDGDLRRDAYDEFYARTLQVIAINVHSFAEHAQALPEHASTSATISTSPERQSCIKSGGLVPDSMGRVSTLILCRACARDCVCDHSVLVTSVFKKTVQVPTNWVADTPALSKRTNRLRAKAGPRRARLIKENAK